MANVNSTDSCISCKFFITGGQLGSCRRFPQALNKAPSDWCGEYIFANVARTKDELTPVNVTFTQLNDYSSLNENKPKRIKK